MSNDAHKAPLSRRRFLQLAATTLAATAFQPAYAFVQTDGERKLALYNTHTGESLRIPYWEQGRYLPDALADINHLLRDHRTDKIAPIDPELLDLLYALQQRVGTHRAFQVISGYRSPATNAMLRQRSSGVAKRSLHMEGRAIDINLPGYSLAKLRQAAISLQRGGVGYYPKSHFIHLDTGRVRYW